MAILKTKDLSKTQELYLCLQLLDLGKKLHSLPASDDVVLKILESAEDLLKTVGQEPSQAICDALHRARNGLTGDWLLKHENMDIKVSLMYCIHEIIRITAPDAAYCNNHMKIIFRQTIENVFGKLTLLSDTAYEKALRILKTVAKVKCSLVLLDLESNALIVQMFQIFLDSIEHNYTDDVFSNMEAIMTCLIQEGDDFSLDLVKPLFDAVNIENQGISAPSRRLALQVLKNCSDRVKPYLIEQVEQTRKNFDALCNILASIEPQSPTGENVLIERENDDASSHKPMLEEVDTSSPRDSYKSSLVKASMALMLMNHASWDSISHEKIETLQTNDALQSEDGSGAEAFGAVAPDGNVNSSNALQYDDVHSLEIVEGEQVQPEKFQSKETMETKSSGEVDALEQEDQTNDAIDVVHPEVSEIRGSATASEGVVKRARGSHFLSLRVLEWIDKENNIVKEYVQYDPDSGEEGTEGYEEILAERREIREEVKKHYSSSGWNTSSGKQLKRKNHVKQKTVPEKRKKRKGKTTVPESKAEVLPEGFKKPRYNKKYREEIIDSRVMVWWPEDQQFYEGVVKTYDPIKKEHKVVYLDGDVEILNLGTEIWLLGESRPLTEKERWEKILC
ncbi:OLC1v1005613C1 [Oldenlandia corymbosa var. corymbosa]|uniref:OLC1v1005613C1 n=1 Tax=Oldenlandia corymbosa var. corymbosa TaxID=529605 RepID=A0AAV1DF21_OLDCO|nr:OLC1v1005613C1 [Oldenlandia corymbosa var. corymbosa]